MRVFDILAKLEASLTSVPRFPGFGRGFVDTSQVAALVEELKEALPADLREAEEVLQRRETLLNQALSEATSIRSQSEEEVRKRIDQSEVSEEAYRHADEIVKAAEERAQQIVADAERKARRLRDEAESFYQERTAGADQYSRDVLLYLEQEMSEALASVRKGLDRLEVQHEVRS